nr:adenosine deaminase [Propionibacteriales bacterium]
GFGLSNDERRGEALAFAKAFDIARRAGLLSTPHGGELCGAESVWSCLDGLGAQRIGHGVRSIEDPVLVAHLADAGVTLEICPQSNVALGVYPDLASVPLRQLFNAGIAIALGADDPLLFGSRLLDQYEAARHVHGFSDAELAELARMSVRGSAAPPHSRARLLSDIDAWLAA